LAVGLPSRWSIRVSPGGVLISLCPFPCIRRKNASAGSTRPKCLPPCSGVAAASALQRTRYTETQTHFDRDERMQNLKGAFRLRRGSNVQDLRMLLVDDVLTTGSTLSECASVLKKAGALSVHAATAARG
jgi:hypothetical protein